MAGILALDIGTKRVGIAFADAAQRVAVPVETAARESEVAEKRILQLISERSVTVLVVGLPLNEDGSRSPQCDNVEKFARRIARRAAVEVVFVDEYGTSYEAEELLASSGKPANKDAREKGAVDKVAATLILESYLKNGSGTGN